MTLDIENLTIHSDYQGNDVVKIGNNNSIPITRSGSSFYYSYNHVYKFNDVLCVRQSCSNLLSISAFTNTNDVSIEFFPDSFVIKDISTKEPLHTSRNDNGLYSMFLQHL